MEKEKVKVKIPTCPTASSELTFQVTLTSPPTEEGIFETMEGPLNCRDYINDRLIAVKNPTAEKCGMWSGKPNVWPDLKKLRIFIVCHKNSIEYVDNAVKIVNIYEKLARWKSRSKLIECEPLFKQKPGVYESNTFNKNLENTAYLMVESPKTWLICTQMVSMLTLLLRTCTRLKLKEEFKSIREINTYWLKKCRPNGDLYNDATSLMPHCWPKWQYILSNYSKIFKNLPQEELYPASGVGVWHGQGGIKALCTGSTKLKVLQKRIQKFCPMPLCLENTGTFKKYEAKMKKAGK